MALNRGKYNRTVGCWAVTKCEPSVWAKWLQLLNLFGCVLNASDDRFWQKIISGSRPNRQTRWTLLDATISVISAWSTTTFNCTIKTLHVHLFSDSVMHYSAYAFAINPSKPTMLTKTGKTNMGNNSGLTAVCKFSSTFCLTSFIDFSQFKNDLVFLWSLVRQTSKSWRDCTAINSCRHCLHTVTFHQKKVIYFS